MLLRRRIDSRPRILRSRPLPCAGDRPRRSRNGRRTKGTIEVCFRGRSIGVLYPDLIVNQTILVEVKATASIENFAIAQTLNYLKVAGGGVGLLLNFGHKAESQLLVMGDPFNGLPVLRQSTEHPAEGDNVAEKL